MGTTADKLAKLKHTKSQIQSSITEKGVTVSDTDTFASYADKIREISGGAGGGIEASYEEYGFGYVLEDKTLLELAKRSHEKTKGWVNYSKAMNNKTISFIPLLGLNGLTRIKAMFYGCSSLITIPPLDTRKVRDMSTMFNNCYSLTTLPLLEAQSLTNATNMFTNSFSLTTLGGFKSLKASLDLTQAPNLTVDSLLNVINHLFDMSELNSATLTLGAENLAKLTLEQQAIAIDKNWVLY